MRLSWMLVAVMGCRIDPVEFVGVDGGGGDDSGIPERCTGDAVADFDATPGGGSSCWRYLNDRRDRTWLPMNPTGNVMVGEATNRIRRCVDVPSITACQGLPDGLLVSSSGTGVPCN